MKNLDEISVKYRERILQILEYAGRGHIGSAFSIIEILRVLYDDILRYKPDQPKWEGRDRFILSKGHGCLALYVMLAEKGFFPKEELNKFCSFDSILGGHPEAGKVPGVEASTGSLGHGLPIAAGIALSGKMDKKDFKTFALLGDGECDEGTVWEAAMFASKHKLNRLTVMVDYNKMQSYGKTCDVMDLEPFADKWKSFGFCVKEVDGHDVAALKKVLKSIPFDDEKPGALICHTVKGKGIASIEWDASWHHKSKIPQDVLGLLRKELGGEE